MKIKLFTHTDLDGVGCPIIMKRAFDNVDYELCDYSDIDEEVKEFFLSAEYKNYDEVFITDISVKEEVAEIINKAYENHEVSVWLLDHHATAEWLNKYKWAEVKVTYQDQRKTKTSGTSLLYDWLVEHDHISKEDWNTAQFVEKVRRYDTWDWQAYGDTHAKELNDLFHLIGQDSFIDRFIKDTDPEFKEEEKLLLRVEKRRIEQYIDKKRGHLHKTTVNGHKVGIVFAELYHSELGNTLALDNKDLDFIVMLNPGSGRISYRSAKDGIHVGEFAKGYGGGGHAEAAGSPLDPDLISKWVEEVFKIKES